LVGRQDEAAYNTHPQLMTQPRGRRYLQGTLGRRKTALSKAEIKPWDVLESSTAFDSPWLRVRKDVVRTNRDTVTDYYVVERFDYAVVVAVTADRQVLTVRQYKHGAAQVVRELPAGYIEAGEEPLLCARRELREETGYEAAQIKPLGVMYASPSASSHHAHLFLATGLRKVGQQQLDAHENIAVEELDLAEAVASALRNEDFRDLNSTTALLMAWHHLSPGLSPHISPMARD
jgi:ADP-ribose pyrophosphatase